MTTQDGDGFERLEHRARAAFEAGAETLDATTLARLHVARRRAVAVAADVARMRAAGRRGARFGWIAGTLAACLLAAALLLRLPGESAPESRAVTVQSPQTPVGEGGPGQEPLEMMAAGEEFEMATAAEDLEFYQWVEVATVDGSNGQG